MFNISKKLKELQPKTGDILFIAIDGYAGSGKSTLAKKLSKKLDAEIIHTDDFASWDNMFDWQDILIEKVFSPIKNGTKKLTYQPNSWWDAHNPEKVIDQPVTPIMIVEGVASFHPKLKDFISLRIFVNTPEKVCFERGVERDVATGEDKEKVVRLWKEWLEVERAYMEKHNPKNQADIIVDGNTPFDEQINLS